MFPSSFLESLLEEDFSSGEASSCIDERVEAASTIRCEGVDGGPCWADQVDE